MAYDLRLIVTQASWGKSNRRQSWLDDTVFIAVESSSTCNIVTLDIRPIVRDKTSATATNSLNVSIRVKARRCGGTQFKCETTRVCVSKRKAFLIIK